MTGVTAASLCATLRFHPVRNPGFSEVTHPWTQVKRGGWRLFSTSLPKHLEQWLVERCSLGVSRKSTWPFLPPPLLTSACCTVFQLSSLATFLFQLCLGDSAHIHVSYGTLELLSFYMAQNSVSKPFSPQMAETHTKRVSYLFEGQRSSIFWFILRRATTAEDGPGQSQDLGA